SVRARDAAKPGELHTVLDAAEIGVGDGHRILERARSDEGGGYFDIRRHVGGRNENGFGAPSLELPAHLGKFDVVANRKTDMASRKLDDGKLRAGGKKRRLLVAKKLDLSVDADVFTL